MNTLEELRKQIDQIDAKLITVLSDRMKLVKKIGTHKKMKGIPPLDKKRWEQVLTSKLKLAQSQGLNMDFIRKLYELIHEQALLLEQKT